MEFAEFMNENPTIFHFTAGVASLLTEGGFVEISERDPPQLKRGGRYFVIRNGTNIIAFVIGDNFVAGDDGFAIVASHIDANRISLKPTTFVPETYGFLRIGTAAYADGMNSTWWDRDLGLGGRVVVKTRGGSVVSRLVRIPGVVGSIPSLASHFGAIANKEKANPETNKVPVFAASADFGGEATETEQNSPLADKHPVQLLRAIALESQCNVEDLLELELELFSAEEARIGGLNKDLLYCGRMDDRLCSYTAIKALIDSDSTSSDHVVKMVALYDNEEVGSLSRSGAQNKLMETVIGLVHESLYSTRDERVQSAANSIALSADVTHAGNPNYAAAYSAGHVPLLNTGMTVKQLGRFTSNSVDAAICELISEHASVPLQRFAPRNDTASGGTIGPMRAASLGMRTIDIGIPILSMHSIREVTGVKDIALGVKWFRSFFEMSNELTHGNVYL